MRARTTRNGGGLSLRAACRVLLLGVGLLSLLSRASSRVPETASQLKPTGLEKSQGSRPSAPAAIKSKSVLQTPAAGKALLPAVASAAAGASAGAGEKHVAPAAASINVAGSSSSFSSVPEHLKEHVKAKAQVMEELDAFHSDPEYRFLRGLAQDGSERDRREAAAVAEEEEERATQVAAQDLNDREASLEARVAADGARLRNQKTSSSVAKTKAKAKVKATAKAKRRISRSSQQKQRSATKIPDGAGSKTIPKDGLPEQGFDGAGMPKDKVTHDDLSASASEDWHDEYGHAPPKKAESSSAGAKLGFGATPKSIQALLMLAVALYIF